MPNCANTAEFRVGRSADIVYVRFHAHVISDVISHVRPTTQGTELT